jgi:hypothetical protein
VVRRKGESLADAKLTFEGLVGCGVEHTFKSAPQRTGSVDVWCIYKLSNAGINDPTSSINRDLWVILRGCT